MNTCPICHRGGDGPHDRCRDVLQARLARTPDLYRLLAVVLEPGATTTEHVTTSHTESPMPVRAEPLNLRARGGIVTILADWESLWRERRGLEPPPHRRDDEHALAHIVGFLRAHLDWAVEHDAGVYELNGEIREIRGACHAALGLVTDLVHLGQCPGTDREGRPCRRALYADPWLALIRCAHCTAEWRKKDWPTLNRTLRGKQLPTAA